MDSLCPRWRIQAGKIDIPKLLNQLEKYNSAYEFSLLESVTSNISNDSLEQDSVVGKENQTLQQGIIDCRSETGCTMRNSCLDPCDTIPPPPLAESLECLMSHPDYQFEGCCINHPTSTSFPYIPKISRSSEHTPVISKKESSREQSVLLRVRESLEAPHCLGGTKIQKLVMKDPRREQVNYMMTKLRQCHQENRFRDANPGLFLRSGIENYHDEE